MAKSLTKPQANLLFRAMLEPVVLVSKDRRVAGNLRARKFVELTTGSVEVVRPTRAGLEALLAYWMRKDAASGCLAYQRRRREVEEALAALIASEQAA